MKPEIDIYNKTVQLKNGINDQILVEILSLKPNKIILNSGDWSHVEFLKEFNDFLIHLEINDESFNWKILPQLYSIEKLSIGGWFKCDIDFDKMESLKYLSTYWNDGFDNRLYGAKKLKAISIQGYKNTDLKGFATLENLEFLNIYNSRKLLSSKGLEKLTNLRRLYFLNCSSLKELISLKNNHNLESLRIENCKNLDCLDSIFSCKSLIELNLFNLGNISSISRVSLLSSLKWLVFDTKIQNGDLSFIYEMPSLNVCIFKNKRNYSEKAEKIEEYLRINGKFSLDRFSHWYTYKINKKLPCKL